MISFNNLFFLLLVLSGCNGAIDIQKYLKVCNRNALDANDCMVDAVQKGIAAMIDGIPDLDVPQIDPYLQKYFKLDYNNNQLAVKLVMKNTYVTGLKNSIVKDARLRADDDKFHLEVDLTTPKVTITTNYRGEGKFNVLNIYAYGTINTTMTDLTYTWKLDGVPEKKGNDTYVRITEFYMRPDVGSMFTALENENLESRELTDLGVSFANANWRTLYKEFLPFAQENWNKIGTAIANKVFSKVPYDELFPASS
ncbi:unnamed protein product [Arctia plantaginis]|uniref:Uncharacterized protein n=1 Tax=Arctia plantaginis TaxID=874455 RepID=A0A8S1A7T4_ARCPL|nr:unnamed protein product [Arctia plantaginis]CAB3240560.1 unnamed protein product [Arctia plantaginis]